MSDFKDLQVRTRNSTIRMARNTEDTDKPIQFKVGGMCAFADKIRLTEHDMFVHVDMLLDGEHVAHFTAYNVGVSRIRAFAAHNIDVVEW